MRALRNSNVKKLRRAISRFGLRNYGTHPWAALRNRFHTHPPPITLPTDRTPRTCRTAAATVPAKLKYFQHAGALLTADGTDDELIKFEGVPAGYKLKVP